MSYNHFHHEHREPEPDTVSFWRSRAFLVFLGFGAIALVLLWEEHRAHILGALPYLLLLACPLMHMFMHGGHGHGSHHRDEGEPPAKAAARRPEEVQ
jgi:hypothetical protein